jgi:hypothetical protein
MQTTSGSFGDMFSSGINNFKTAFDNFKPRITNCLMLTVPFSLIFTILSIVIVGGTTMLGVGAAQQATTQDAAVAAVVGGVLLGMVILVIAISPFAAYFGFCFLRFTSQATANPSQTFSFGLCLPFFSVGIHWPCITSNSDWLCGNHRRRLFVSDPLLPVRPPALPHLCRLGLFQRVLVLLLLRRSRDWRD